MADQPDRSLRSMMTVITLPKVPKTRMRVVLILPNQPPSRLCVMTGMTSRIVPSSSRFAESFREMTVVMVMLVDGGNSSII